MAEKAPPNGVLRDIKQALTELANAAVEASNAGMAG